jgi:hypothetical protein
MDRLKESMRLVLEKPDFAEQAIRDLARWEDWTVLDRLVTMFDEADPKTYVKEPIVAYLDQAAHQEGAIGEQATAALTKIEAADPDTVKRARSLMSFGFLGFARPGSRDPGEAPPQNNLGEPTNGQPPANEAPKDEVDATAPQDEAVESAPEEESTTKDQQTSTKSAEESTVAGPATTEPKTINTVPAGANPSLAPDPPLVPPSQTLVMSVPLIAAGVFVGVVWLVLRGGL